MSYANQAIRQEPFSITPLDAPLGAEVQGFDARRDPGPQQILALKQALRDHHILIFHDQQLDDDQYLRFTSWFGTVYQPPTDYPVLASDPYGRTPDIVRVANVEGGHLQGNRELTPHIDHQWTPSPSASSLLYALAVPEEGGETTWTNLALAYAELDEVTRQEIDGLRLITYNPFVRYKDGYGGRILYRTPDIVPIQGAEHPLVRIHPESGRPVLYLSTDTEVEIPGYSAERGGELIERLRRHVQQPRFSYTHRWRVGDIVHWDNQATLHARNPFPAEQTRNLIRISLAGSRPF